MIDDVLRLLRATPFIPFELAARDGKRKWLVDRPGQVAVPPSAGYVVIATDQGPVACAAGDVLSATPLGGRKSRAMLEDIRLVVFDFDGVWSNNQVLVMQDGTEGVLCNRSDGLGLEMLRKAGFPMMVLSKEVNPVVAARCRKVRVECVQGIDDKLGELTRICRERGIGLDAVAYVGNDINDVPCMNAVGLSIAVADAYPEALAAASVVTSRKGGDGAVREVCQWFLNARPAAGA